MVSRVSEKTKIMQRRGTGHKASYKPWILVNEMPGHRGVHHNLVDWKHGRQTHLLSDGEYYQYLILRWDDTVDDIREQFPLDLDITTHLCSQFKGFRHPSFQGAPVHMTSDLLVDYIDGHQKVYSVKYSRSEVHSDDKKAVRTAKKLWIERLYWTDQGVDWHLVYTEAMNKTYALNIAAVVYYWYPATVTDKISLFKFLVAHKQIDIDEMMQDHPIDVLEFYKLANDYICDEDLPKLMNMVHLLSEATRQLPEM